MAAKYLGMDDLATERDSLVAVLHIPFDSECKFMGVVVEIPNQGHRLFVKGASEIIHKHCTRVLNSRTPMLQSLALTTEDQTSLNETINE
jgi:magnesium-transporting ATPase (P-type)